MRNRLGYESIPSRQGEINPESRFILERFGTWKEANFLNEVGIPGEELVYLDRFLWEAFPKALADIDEGNIIRD